MKDGLFVLYVWGFYFVTSGDKLEDYKNMETEAEKRTRMTHMSLQHQSRQESQRGIHTTNMLQGFLTQLAPTRPSLGSGNDLNNKNVETIPKALMLLYTPSSTISLGTF